MCTYVERAHCTDCTEVYRLYRLSVWVGVCRRGSQAQSSVRGHHQTVAPVFGHLRPGTSCSDCSVVTMESGE